MLGAVPIVMGVTWGVFQEEGVEVELVPLPSQRDRMLAFQAGQVDVVVTDLTGALLLVSMLPREAVIVGSAFAPAPDSAHLALVTPVPFSRIASWDELVARLRGGERVQIALPRQSDLEFVVDELLRGVGLSVSPDLFIGQDNLLVNATWTLFGMVAVGALPQPYVDFILNFIFEGRPTLAVLQWVAGSSIPPEVIVFRRSLIARHPDLLPSFFRALRRSVARLNGEEREEVIADALPVVVDMFFPGGGPQDADPEERAQIEAAIAAIAIPIFPEPGPVDREMYDRVMVWAMRMRYLRAPIPYDAAVVPPPG